MGKFVTKAPGDDKIIDDSFYALGLASVPGYHEMFLRYNKKVANFVNIFATEQQGGECILCMETCCVLPLKCKK